MVHEITDWENGDVKEVELDNAGEEVVEGVVFDIVVFVIMVYNGGGTRKLLGMGNGECKGWM